MCAVNVFNYVTFLNIFFTEYSLVVQGASVCHSFEIGSKTKVIYFNMSYYKQYLRKMHDLESVVTFTHEYKERK
jgi:hypothetical protein